MIQAVINLVLEMLCKHVVEYMRPVYLKLKVNKVLNIFQRNKKSHCQKRKKNTSTDIHNFMKVHNGPKSFI